MADSTAMTVDFLRARLLSERSVSRASKERADELTKKVAELEEQVREVTAQGRQAERAAAEVLAILGSQGFSGHLSDADDDSGSDVQDGEEEEDATTRGDTARAPGDVAAAQGEAEDAMSGTAQLGGLSWKGRSVSPRKARQLKQKHRWRYLYLLSSSDSSPKYRMGQSCRKNKRQTVTSSSGGRTVSPGEEDGGHAVAAESQKAGQHDGSDCTYDGGQDDMDGEAGSNERSLADGGGGQYVIRYEKDGEMERMLERQAELIGQYEEEEKAQREWEKQYNDNRNANKAAAEAEHNQLPIREAREHSNQGASQAAPCHDKVLQKGSLSESPKSTAKENGAQTREANDEPGQSCAQTASVPAQESSNASTATRQNQEPGDEISEGDSVCNGNAPPHLHCAIKTQSERSDTLNSKVSDWSSSHFHDHTADSQRDTQSSRPASSSSRSIVDVGSVLEALQRARISLSARLSKPAPPSQVMLALPAPGDEFKEYDDLPGDEGSKSYREERSSSSPARQEILALPAPEGYQEQLDLTGNDTGIAVKENPSSSSHPPRGEILALPAPGDDYRREIEHYIKIPVCTPGLFRLPTDSFPADQRMFSGSSVCGSGFNLGAAAGTRHAAGSLSNPPAHGGTTATDVPSTSGDGSGLPAQQCYDQHCSSSSTAGRCNSIARPHFFPFWSSRAW